MNRECEELAVDGTAADDAAREASLRAQIEQRLQHVFRLAGDGAPAQQLLRMVLEYRSRQQS